MGPTGGTAKSAASDGSRERSGQTTSAPRCSPGPAGGAPLGIPAETKKPLYTTLKIQKVGHNRWKSPPFKSKIGYVWFVLLATKVMTPASIRNTRKQGSWLLWPTVPMLPLALGYCAPTELWLFGHYFCVSKIKKNKKKIKKSSSTWLN